MDMINRPRIPDSEFVQRAKNVQKLMKEQNVDALLAFGNEAEPQFARYLCDYWPSFESCGVLLAQEGDPVLLIGPESLTFAADRSRVKDIRRLAAFRESSNPEYPGHKLETVADVLDGMLGGSSCKRFAIAGYNLIPHITYMELAQALSKFGEVEICRGDELMMELRMIKSENELACMRHAGKITAKAFDYVLENIRPGMTELQVRGLANAALYEAGAENESYPIWVLAGAGGDQAISRARHKVIEKNDFVFLQIGARYEGYASTIGRPVFFGKPEQYLVDAVKVGYQAEEAVISQLYAGNNAANVAKAHMEVMEKNGYVDWLLYGPCHGNGLMEGEAPWIESNSDYILRENQTYCACLFMGDYAHQRGFRIEDVLRVGNPACENITNYRKELFFL